MVARVSLEIWIPGQGPGLLDSLYVNNQVLLLQSPNGREADSSNLRNWCGKIDKRIHAVSEGAQTQDTLDPFPGSMWPKQQNLLGGLKSCLPFVGPRNLNQGI